MSESQETMGLSPEDEKEFQWQAFQAGFSAPISGRYWFFPEGDFGFASFGSSGAVGFTDGTMRVTHVMYGAVRMHRSGWLNLIRTMREQLSVTDEEWNDLAGKKEGDVTS